jgi:hypothetical protein
MTIESAKATTTPLNTRSLTLPVPDVFDIDSFNTALTKWRKHILDNPDKSLGQAKYLLIGKRQMREVRAMSESYDSNNTDSALSATLSFGPTKYIEMIEKDQEDWFEVVDSLAESA